LYIIIKISPPFPDSYRDTPGGKTLHLIINGDDEFPPLCEDFGGKTKGINKKRATEVALS
jgi:ribosomal protein L34E